MVKTHDADNCHYFQNRDVLRECTRLGPQTCVQSATSSMDASPGIMLCRNAGTQIGAEIALRLTMTSLRAKRRKTSEAVDPLDCNLVRNSPKFAQRGDRFLGRGPSEEENWKANAPSISEENTLVSLNISATKKGRTNDEPRPKRCNSIISPPVPESSVTAKEIRYFICGEMSEKEKQRKESHNILARGQNRAMTDTLRRNFATVFFNARQNLIIQRRIGVTRGISRDCGATILCDEGAMTNTGCLQHCTTNSHGPVHQDTVVCREFGTGVSLRLANIDTATTDRRRRFIT